MSQFQGVRVEGARELRRALTKAGLDLKQDIKDAHKASATIVERRASNLCPVAPQSMSSAKPGLLKSTLRSSGTQTAAIVRAGRKNVPYAGPIQWGWHKRNIRPTFFITRAASASEPEWIKEYEERFDAILDEIANSTQGQQS